MALHLKLFVFVQGLGTAFPVSIERSETVGDLKEAILKKKINDLKAVDADRLTLWKPMNVIPVKPSQTLAERIGDLGPDFSKFAGALDAADVVADVFQPSTSPQLDVIVQVPASVPDVVDQPPRKRHRSVPSDRNWLFGLYREIWDRRDLKMTLFREVKVTPADYAKLQVRLKDLHSDRGSEDYDGAKDDVRSVKVNFLQSLTQSESLSSRNPDTNVDQVDNDDNSGAGNKDDSELNSLFPFILSYMDLSPLELQHTPPRIPLPLLIRQDYKDLSELINKMSPNGAGSVMVSGQPGIGKTAYLYYRIIENMIEGRPFLYQGLDGTVYHVAESGVEMIWEWWASNPIVAFVDGDEGEYAPAIFLRLPSVQLIVASSPKGANKKWTEQTGAVTTFVAKLWSYQELLLTGIFLNHYDVSFKLLRESASYFGNNPRRCFRASTSHTLFESQKGLIASAIKDVNKERLSDLLVDARTGGSEVFNKIFQISPDASRFLSNCRFEAVSRWALDLLLRQYEIQKS